LPHSYHGVLVLYLFDRFHLFVSPGSAPRRPTRSGRPARIGSRFTGSAFVGWVVFDTLFMVRFLLDLAVSLSLRYYFRIDRRFATIEIILVVLNQYRHV
jgi:hypothetical protein